MKVNVLQLALAILFSAFMMACQSGTQSASNPEITTDETDNTIDMTTEEFVNEYPEGIPVYYNMYLTVELSSLFENEGAMFRQDLLNPVEKTKEYITSSEKALNLGVYAVDLAYSRVFEQYQKAGSYFSAMYRLAEELGIPENFIYSTSDRLEQNISNKDSLNKIANEIYMATDKYLKENERENAAALIVLGGWIESLYLGSEVFNLENENDDFEYMQRLVEQKVSLEKLIKLLNQYPEDETISEILPKLKELKPLFDAFDVDANNINASIKQLNGINEKVTGIRKRIIS